MNYDEARQIQDKETGELYGWRWTTKNDGHIRTAAPCISFDGPFSSLDIGKPLKPENIHQCPQHATREEAERHFYDYCVEQAHEITLMDWARCTVCDKPTKRSLGNHGLWLLFTGMTPLCDEHHTKEQLKKLSPFTSPIIVIHS